MKRIVLFAAFLMVGASASAKGVSLSRISMQIARNVAAVSPMAHFTPGDTCNYDLTVLSYTGTMDMSVKSVGSDGVWIDQLINIAGQKIDQQELIDPATGAIKKLIVNGKEQTPPDPNDVKIISENKADITVKAGTFHTIDVKAHIVSQNTDEELWIDPTNIPVAGLAKLSTTAQGMPVNSELTKITHGTGLN